MALTKIQLDRVVSDAGANNQYLTTDGNNLLWETATPFDNITRLGTQNWSTNTGEAVFDVVDVTEYVNYLIYFYISGGPGWSTTWFQFRTGAGVNYATAVYNNSMRWRQSVDSTAAVDNSATYAGPSNTGAWVAGNGTAYDMQGALTISIPNYSSGCASIRGTTSLMNRTADSLGYSEDMATYIKSTSLNPTTITGFRLVGTTKAGTDNSVYGSVQCYGVRL